jgi:purine-nucleoside phosphorylase
VHTYEGHELDTVCFGVSLLAELGCRRVILTNAAGGIDATFLPGDLMLITDHINLSGRNPLVGPHDGRGARFVDLTEAYDLELRELALQAAAAHSLVLRQGVYAGVLGPSYETPAEVRMLARLGASAVGMSTVLEVIALRYLGVRVAALSCITNAAAGLSATPLTHEEVQETAARVRVSFQDLLRTWVLSLP